jgi:NTE family protein
LVGRRPRLQHPARTCPRPARGPLPTSIAEAEERVSDIRFSSRTRLVTNVGLKLDAVRKAGRALLDVLPPELSETPAARALARQVRGGGRVVIGQLIYRDQPVRGKARGRDFSRTTMRGHWAAGLRDMNAGIARAARLVDNMPEGITSHDLTAPETEPLQEAAQ